MGHRVHVISQHQKQLIALLAVLLLSVTILVQHSHDGVVSDPVCIVCLYQANFDSVLSSAPRIPEVIVTRVYADHFHSRFVQFSCVQAVARSPPIFLVG